MGSEREVLRSGQERANNAAGVAATAERDDFTLPTPRIHVECDAAGIIIIHMRDKAGQGVGVVTFAFGTAQANR